jgi:hypothetical protein
MEAVSTGLEEELHLEAGLESAVVAAPPAIKSKVNPPDPWITPRDEAIFLLQKTAEVEHALMVQYLYAAFSLDPTNALLSEEQKKGVGEWQQTILKIAREEMAHFASMQNLLRLLGGPIHLEREAFPFRSDLYPFQFRLEPLTLRSLARYIAAERPETISDVTIEKLYQTEIEPLAREGNAREPINRVGALFDRLLLLFDDTTAVPSGGVSKVVENGDLDVDVGAYLATASDWGGGGLIVGPASEKIATPESARKAIRETLKEIAAQGEGYPSPTAGATKSHFERFVEVWQGYRKLFPIAPSSDIGPGAPARPVPTDPTTDPAAGSSAITEETSRKWAQLANFRYRMILNYLQHYFLYSVAYTRETHRDDLRTWVFDDMPTLGSLARYLVAQPRITPNLADRAAVPFEIPYTNQLPDREIDRWRVHRDVLTASIRLLEKLAGGAGVPGNVGEKLLKSDNARLAIVLDNIKRSPGPCTGAESAGAGGSVVHPVSPSPSGVPTPQQAAMLDLLKTKQPIAKSRHSAIPAGGGTLKDLFATEKYDDILAFLRLGSSIRDPATGKRLIVPGKPDESGFFIQITSEEGVMAGRFSDSEIKVVREWILSLSAN